ncbi:MAG TPA: IPT/TIG domain-containing protein [Bryobacteraceae bacterium]|nr:IPT/TIG domain-containing protein [Bryobacteraceae bacterium]
MLIFDLNPICAARFLAVAAALAVPLIGGNTPIQIIAPAISASTGNYGPAHDAAIFPTHIALDTAGNLNFLDGEWSPIVRKVTPGGQVLPVAGPGAAILPPGQRTPAVLKDIPYWVDAFTADTAGNVFVAALDDTFRVFRIGTDGQMEDYSGYPSSITHANALAADGVGNLYMIGSNFFALAVGTQVFKIQPDRTIVPWAGTGVQGYSGDGGPAASAQISAQDIAADSLGNLFLADNARHLVRKVDTHGIIATVAQGGGPIAVDTGGNLYFFLQDGTLRRLAPEGSLSKIATVPNPAGVAVDSAGNVFVAANQRLYSLDATGAMKMIAGCACAGDGVPANQAAVVNAVGVVRDASGNLYISDAGNHTVRRVAPDGTASLFAGTGDPGYSGDGGPARQARLSAPSALALDAAGNLYVAERGNSVIRKVSPAGIIQTVAGDGIAGFGGEGGPATSARIALPDGVAVDSSGNIYISDTANHRIRKVTSDGMIYTIAGSDAYGSSGDGGPASQALLINPRALAFDLDGSLLIADSSANMVRRITPSGAMQRVAGTGAAAHKGDGGLAISAGVYTPWGLAVDSSGNILIGEIGNYTIRLVDRSGSIGTLATAGEATGLASDTAGNLWIAEGAFGLLSQSGSPFPAAPVVFDNGVSNSASGQIAVVAPGEMVTISGAGLGPAVSVAASGSGGVFGTELGGVHVLFDGVAAPLMQVSASQIQALVPFAVSGKSTVGVQVEYGGMTSNTEVIGVLPAVPGIFNQYRDALSWNSPGRPGSVVSIVVTGSGVMVPPETDGQVEASPTSVPVLPVSVYLGTFPFPDSVPWTPLEVTYAGSASWLISGAIQFNFRLPDPLPNDGGYGAFPIAVRVGDSLSGYSWLPVTKQ